MTTQRATNLFFLDFGKSSQINATDNFFLRLNGDHLGNVRLSYADTNNDGEITASSDPNTNEIIDEKNYYPFGLKHKGYNNIVSSNGNSTAQKFGFGGKEHQDELGLGWIDITARNYDAAIGRWMNLDPLAEKGRRNSPYNFAFNNPIYFQDYDGMWPDPPGWIRKAANTVQNVVTKVSEYAGNKLSESGHTKAGTIVKKSGEAINNMIDNGVEGKIDFKAEANFTVGARVAAGYKGLATLDANIASAELFGASYESKVNEQGERESKTEFDYANKDGTNDISQGFEVGGILLGGGGGIERTYEQANGTGAKTNDKTEINGRISPLGTDLSYNTGNGEITARKTKGIDFSFGAIGVITIKIEFGIEGKADID